MKGYMLPWNHAHFFYRRYLNTIIMIGVLVVVYTLDRNNEKQEPWITCQISKQIIKINNNARLTLTRFWSSTFLSFFYNIRQHSLYSRPLSLSTLSPAIQPVDTIMCGLSSLRMTIIMCSNVIVVGGCSLLYSSCHVCLLPANWPAKYLITHKSIHSLRVYLCDNS